MNQQPPFCYGKRVGDLPLQRNLSGVMAFVRPRFFPPLPDDLLVSADALADDRGGLMIFLRKETDGVGDGYHIIPLFLGSVLGCGYFSVALPVVFLGGVVTDCQYANNDQKDDVDDLDNPTSYAEFLLGHAGHLPEGRVGVYHIDRDVFSSIPDCFANLLPDVRLDYTHHAVRYLGADSRYVGSRAPGVGDSRGGGMDDLLHLGGGDLSLHPVLEEFADDLILSGSAICLPISFVLFIWDDFP